MSQNNSGEASGILLVNKPRGKTAFSLVACLRRILKVRKIGHAGTLDPFATGVMVMLVGKQYTRLSDQFLCEDKEYVAQVRLGISTDSYDCDGKMVNVAGKVPTLDEVQSAIAFFQGEIEQIPPMFSAKKVNGKKLYELARKGKVIERAPVKVKLRTALLGYDYPFINISVACSKGTYIRSIAHDLGEMLGCGAHLSVLERTRSGPFCLDSCLAGDLLYNSNTQGHDLICHLKKPYEII